MLFITPKDINFDAVVVLRNRLDDRYITEIILMWIASMPALTKLCGRRPFSSWLWHSIAPHNDREVHVGTKLEGGAEEGLAPRNLGVQKREQNEK